jgi:hypothetical protein
MEMSRQVAACAASVLLWRESDYATFVASARQCVSLWATIAFHFLEFQGPCRDLCTEWPGKQSIGDWKSQVSNSFLVSLLGLGNWVRNSVQVNYVSSGDIVGRSNWNL